MGRDTDLTTVIRDIVQFLERLRDVKLPAVLEELRGDLLGRSKNALLACAAIGRGTSSSPEPYLSMSPGNGSAARGLLLLPARDGQIWKDDDPQEYVGADEPVETKKDSQPDYYETFQDVQTPVEVPPEPPGQSKRANVDATLADIYACFSAVQTRSKCTKCGPLRKGGKKLFLFEQHRECWAGLVGSHLLIYGSEKDNRPYMVQSIRGYTARPAANAIPRDPKKSESTFELFSQGNKTLQFIARSPKDMEQWIANISRVNEESVECELTLATGSVKAEDNTVDRAKENVEQETYQDVGTSKMNDSKEDVPTTRIQRSPVTRGDEKPKDTEMRSAEKLDGEVRARGRSPRRVENPAPPLPARIPRRLPSLPLPDGSGRASYRDVPEDEDEDDFYHRIEDFKDLGGYQNVPKKSSARRSKMADDAVESYDDVQAVVKSRGTEKMAASAAKRKSVEAKETLPAEIVEEIYDDVAAVLRNENKRDGKAKGSGKDEENEVPSYDDIQSATVHAKPGKEQRRKQEKNIEATEEPTKSPQKKSFLDRVRSGRKQQRDASAKTEKKSKRKTPTPPPIASQEAEGPLYDDVSNLPIASRAEAAPPPAELPEYNSPPPPRPIFTPLPSIPVIEVEEIYDDIGAVRRRVDEDGSAKANPIATSVNGNDGNGRELTEVAEEVEHYQSPKSPLPVAEQPEELYDDIAILADFKARRRELAGKIAEEAKSPSNSPGKKPWNRRFVASRKSKCSETLGENLSAETNGQRSSSEIDDVDVNPGETSQKCLVRKNTFQKLIDKMESSLSKSSSLSPNKTNPASDSA